MIEWIKIWVQGIIFAVIISSIIEMIIPEGKNKKYIKTVIGIYIVYVIIDPIVSQFTGRNLQIDMSKYLQNDSEMTYSAINVDDAVKKNYIENLKNDIKNNLQERGYKAENIDIKINEDDRYGEITEIKLSLTDEYIKIGKINISNKEEQNKKYEDIKAYLSKEYGTDNIQIK